jgi:Putative beta-barrel porin-2, OmpL-like. bbp2
MRKLAITCLTIAALVGGKSFAIGAQPVQPASVLPTLIRPVKYIYDPGEDLDEKYVYPSNEQSDEVAEPAPVAADSEVKQPTVPTTRTSAPAPPAPSAPVPIVKVTAPQDDVDGTYGGGDACNGESCGCCDCGRSCWSDCVGEFTLDGALGCECSPWNTGGWTEMGYTSNNVPLSQSYNDLRSFNDVSDNVNLNQQWFYVERTVDGSCGWDLGGRIDAVYGTDAQKTQSFGNPGGNIRGIGFFDASWDHGPYGFAMPQLYGEVAYHDLSVKVGHFLSLIGYESTPAPGNFFYTHSYTFQYSEPNTHTGVVAAYTGVAGATLYSGWTLGWDTGFDQLDGGSNWLGGFSAQATDDVTFTYICTIGNFGWRDGGSSGSYDHSIVLITDLSDKLQYVFESDNLRTDNPGVSKYDTIGAVNYLFYTVSDRAKLGGRIEWWKADGVSYNEFTVGVNFNPLENLVVRPEWRQDWAPGADLNEDTFAIDAVWSY